MFLFQSMLRYKSYLLRMTETVLMLPMLILGSTEEKQIVTTELFEDYQEDAVRKNYEFVLENDTTACTFINIHVSCH